MKAAGVLMMAEEGKSGIVSRNLKHPTKIRVLGSDDILRETVRVWWSPVMRQLYGIVDFGKDGGLKEGILRYRAAVTRREKQVAVAGLIWELAGGK